LTCRRRDSRTNLRSQGLTQNLVDRIDQNELHLGTQVGRYVVEVRLVAGRQQHSPDSRAVRAQHLFLDASNRQHPTAQSDFACHCDVITRGTSGEDRRHRGQHSHTR